MEMNGLSETRRSNAVQGFTGAGLHNGLGDCDPWTAWAYKPRTISLLLIGTCLLIWASGALDPESTASHDIVTSVKRGVWAMIAVFLAYSLLQAPSTVLIRPHSDIWRLVHGMAVVYLVALTFLLFQIHSRVYRIHACSVSFLEHRRHQFAGSTTLHMETHLGDADLLESLRL